MSGRPLRYADEAGVAWAAVVGFTSYEVSDDGRVRRRRGRNVGRELRPYTNPPNGYLRVALYRNGGASRQRRRELYLHRLVAIYHVPGMSAERREVHHMNDEATGLPDVRDCRASRLAWTTQRENLWARAPGNGGFGYVNTAWNREARVDELRRDVGASGDGAAPTRRGISTSSRSRPPTLTAAAWGRGRSRLRPLPAFPTTPLFEPMAFERPEDEQAALEAFRGKTPAARGPKREDREHREQRALFDWLDVQSRREPLFAFVHACPNGDLRDKATAAKMKAEGVKPGAPDLFFDVARGGWHGARVEMKAPAYPGEPASKAGSLSSSQIAFREHYDREGFAYFVAFGWQEAADFFELYLRGGYARGGGAGDENGPTSEEAGPLAPEAGSRQPR